MRSSILAVLCAGCACAAPPFHASFDIAGNGAWTASGGPAIVDNAVRHNGKPSLRLDGDGAREGLVYSAPVSLNIGHSYILSGWIHTQDFRLRDRDHSPVATGAALAMESMPFDVHTPSVGAATAWTRVQLPFVATRAQDRIALHVAEGAGFNGKVWFSDISLDEGAPSNVWPAPAALTTYGPAYRYPYGGWIYLHIEGKPYDRGYQHGRLMAKEIVSYMDRCAALISSQSRENAWEVGRTTAGALFQPGFDQEILEEMRGIADGASDAGAQWQQRRLDLLDLIVLNTIVEFGELQSAMKVTPSGLEGLGLAAPHYKRGADHDHCSAFAATGPATKDGRMIIGHETWWPLTLGEQTNVMLDIKPTEGHRVLMQSYPGGIESGTDWYQNDAGVVLTETTIMQTPFNAEGTPVAFRARKAIQYGDNIDKVVEYLSTRNNGLYTNEWLIGDAKTNEIAMFELGTYHTKLWRSSRHEWFGGTEGFYWGDNNAKDLTVRLEYRPDPQGQPWHVPYVPGPRDLKWQSLYREYKGRIDEAFAFDALATPPLVSSSAMDAKVVTADMANNLMVWAMFGKPNEREWVPSKREAEQYADNDGIYSSGYRMIDATPDASLARIITANEEARANGKEQASEKKKDEKKNEYKDRLWKGWVLPASDADVWFTAGSEAYYHDLESADLEEALARRRADFRSASAETDEAARHRLETSRGVLLLDALRRRMGDEAFFDLMKQFYAEHTTRPVTAESFIEAAGPPGQEVAGIWMKAVGVPGTTYMLSSIHHLSTSAGQTLIVYGTVTEAGANRYAAEQLQKNMLEWHETAPAILRDFELTDEQLRDHNVIFIGRPETNSALAAIANQIGLNWMGGDFTISGEHHASEREALALAATNPLNARRMIVALSGNCALETVRLARAEDTTFDNVQFAVYDFGKKGAAGFLR